jgi:predicted nucleotidyltransferase
MAAARDAQPRGGKKGRMVEPLEAIRSILERRADVRVAYVFGSTARGQARASSDVDVAVLFDPLPEARALDQITSHLQEVSALPVDLVALNTAPPLLAHEIMKTGRIVICRDEDERVRFETRAAARYLDTAHLRRVQYRYLRERVEGFRARQS